MFCASHSVCVALDEVCGVCEVCEWDNGVERETKPESFISDVKSDEKKQ